MTDDLLSPLSFQILLALADRERYGYAIIQEIERQTEGAMSPKTGSLYAALQRLEEEALIEPSEAPREGEDARRRYYALTPEGRTALQAEARRLARFAAIAERRLPGGAPRLASEES